MGSLIIYDYKYSGFNMSKDKARKSQKQPPSPITPVQHLHVLQPEEGEPMMHAKDWPLLLKNYDKMNVLTTHYTPIPAGSTPLKRPIKDYLKYGIINLDKPSNPSSH
jgi:H/ACA ribonucleoprotein complex subunit 4